MLTSGFWHLDQSKAKWVAGIGRKKKTKKRTPSTTPVRVCPETTETQSCHVSFHWGRGWPGLGAWRWAGHAVHLTAALEKGAWWTRGLFTLPWSQKKKSLHCSFSLPPCARQRKKTWSHQSLHSADKNKNNNNNNNNNNNRILSISLTNLYFTVIC